MMNITLHQLKVFKKVAELGSVTQAAHALHMTQPAVSNILRNLHGAAGTPIIEVLNKKIYLTPAGTRLLAASDQISTILQTTEEQLTQYHEEVRGTLHIATVSTAKYFILKLLGHFKQQHPDIHIRLVVRNRAEILQRLRDNLDDFVIMSQLPQDTSIDSAVIFQDRLVVGIHPKRAQRFHGPQRLAALDQEPWIIREPGSGTRHAMLSLFKRCQFMPPFEMEIDNNESIKHAIMSDLGLSVLSEHSIEHETQAGLLTTLAVEGFPAPLRWYLVKPKGKKLSSLAQRFFDMVNNPHTVTTHT